MRIEAVICISLLACLLSACSSPPTLSEPKGVFISFNPERPSYLSAKNTSKILHQTRKKTPVKPVYAMSKMRKEVVEGIKTGEGKVSATVVKFVTDTPLSPVLSGTTPVSTGSPIKSGGIPKLKPVLPPRIWTVNPGGTLKQVFMKWAGDEKCHLTKPWSVLWNTDTDYPMDSPLTFTGSFEDMTLKLFSLYRHANTPLYVDAYKAQCLMMIHGLDQEKKKGRIK
ncbi:MAG: hypothetical protein HamCj_00050 [Candidatus Hamiltonella defensa (Ceratovacuna japonica)]